MSNSNERLVRTCMKEDQGLFGKLSNSGFFASLRINGIHHGGEEIILIVLFSALSSADESLDKDKKFWRSTSV